jgi:uncharacterized secreted protein with C-terminal beta-propeller domain
MMRQFKKAVFCASLVISFLFLLKGAFAEIQMTAQLTDPQGAKGRINARILQDYTNVDIYVAMITANGDLYCLGWDDIGSCWDWEAGAHPIVQAVSLATSDWLTLAPIDLSLTMGDPLNSSFVVALVTQGTDPLNPDNWVYLKAANFVAQPFDRKPGQTLFASMSTSGNGSPSLGAGDLVSSDAAAAGGGEESTQPEKADIFKISGRRLFYANSSSMRFQMIDLSDPAKPALLASIKIAETPRELFLVGKYAFLIGSSYGAGGPATLLRVYRTGDTLEEVRSVNLGQLTYVTSRRLGNRIYLVGATTNGPEPCCGLWGPGQAAVYALDITSPEQTSVIAQAKAGTSVYDVYMDDQYLILLGSDTWPATELEIFDLSAVDLPLSRKALLTIPGRVPSEYHVHTSDSVLCVVYQQETLSSGSSLITFDLSDFSNIKKMGRVGGIAPGEALFATRFTDDRAYIVTYERKDPLWVVDISTPSLPRTVGELQVPGWSEYMEFFEDRLLAIGYDDSQGKRLVSVALFSVSDPSSPQLLDRVTPVSGRASYSYSEATSDDRVFSFNPQTGMVLFPLHYYDNGTGMNISGLEILKLKEAANGFSWHSNVKSRAHVLRGAETDRADIVLSMGDTILNTIDVSEPPTAFVAGELRLAYNVTQMAGRDAANRLWTLGTDYYGLGNSEAILFEGVDLDTPARVEDTGLGWAQVLMNDKIGILFESQTPRLKAVNLETATLGGAVSIDGATPGSLQSPLLMGKTFYVARAEWGVLPWPEKALSASGPSSGETSEPAIFPPDEVSSSVQWQLLRYDCSNFRAPSALPALSIPGRPIGFTAGGKLVTIEEISASDQPSAVISPVSGGTAGGFLLNLLTIRPDEAILETSRFFSYAEYGYPTVLTDQRAIYVSFGADQSTTIITLSPGDLLDMRRDLIKGLWVPVKAFDGKLLVTTYGNIMPLSGGMTVTDASYAPIPSCAPEAAVYDLIADPPAKILSLDGVYVDTWRASLNESGLYLAKGYAGVSFIPF